jgi:hypothetical protein
MTSFAISAISFIAIFWIYIEIENKPNIIRGKPIYKEYFTVFGIKICKNFRK